MKSKIAMVLILLSSIFTQAAVQEGQIYFVPVEAAKYQLSSGKAATAEIQIGFLSKADAEVAAKDVKKIKSTIETAIKETIADVTTKKGKMVLGAEVTAKLQDAGFKAQTILWNSFLF